MRTSLFAPVSRTNSNSSSPSNAPPCASATTPASPPPNHISTALDSFLFEIAELTQIASSCGMRISEFHTLTRTPEVAEQLTARRELARERLDTIITDAKAVAFRALTVLCADGMLHAQDDHLPHKTRLYYAEITRRAASLILRFAHAHDTAHLTSPAPHPDDEPINFNDPDPASSPSTPGHLNTSTPSSPLPSSSPPIPPAPFSAARIAEVRPLTPHIPTVRLPKPKATPAAPPSDPTPSASPAPAADAVSTPAASAATDRPPQPAPAASSAHPPPPAPRAAAEPPPQHPRTRNPAAHPTSPNTPRNTTTNTPPAYSPRTSTARPPPDARAAAARSDP